jgi:hypothetical protein
MPREGIAIRPAYPRGLAGKSKGHMEITNNHGGTDGTEKRELKER